MGAAALNTIEIRDHEDPRVRPYMNLKDAHLAVLAGRTPADEAAGLFIAEGTLVVGTAIDSDYAIDSILALPARVQSMREELARLPRETPIYVAGREIVERIVGFDLHRGILAACRRGTPRTLDELLDSCRTLVVLEDLANHDNLGGIFRSVAALAGERGGVVLSPRCCDPLYRKAIRVSMGHALRVPFCRAEAWPDDVARLDRADFEVIALGTTASTPIGQLEPGARRALLLGAEGHGLSDEAARAARSAVRIPMTPGVDSLNVVVACAIALHRLAGTDR